MAEIFTTLGMVDESTSATASLSGNEILSSVDSLYVYVDNINVDIDGNETVTSVGTLTKEMPNV